MLTQFQLVSMFTLEFGAKYFHGISAKYNDSRSIIPNVDTISPVPTA